MPKSLKQNNKISGVDISMLQRNEWQQFAEKETRKSWYELLIQRKSLSVAANMVEIGAKMNGWYSDQANTLIINTEFADLSRTQLEELLHKEVKTVPTSTIDLNLAITKQKELNSIKLPSNV